jgi:hypothetical protein
MLTRRKMLCGLLAAPAIVRPTSIMAVKTMIWGDCSGVVWENEAYARAHDEAAWIERQIEKALLETLQQERVPYTDQGFKMMADALDRALAAPGMARHLEMTDAEFRRLLLS